MLPAMIDQVLAGSADGSSTPFTQTQYSGAETLSREDADERSALTARGDCFSNNNPDQRKKSPILFTT